MINEEIKIVVKKDVISNTTSLYVIKIVENKTYVKYTERWNEVDPSASFIEPTLKLENDIFQNFIDELSNEIKPTLQAEVDAELKATKYHLEDMRDLVFKKK